MNTKSFEIILYKRFVGVSTSVGFLLCFLLLLYFLIFLQEVSNKKNPILKNVNKMRKLN